MLPIERHKKMIEMLISKNIVTIPEFISEFDTSIETVRRDLAILEKSGRIEKVYGGAKIKNSSYIEPPMENRFVTRLVQKEWIGKKCSEFINDGDCIYIDSGTTTFQVAKNLHAVHNLTIITNSIPVINEMFNTSHNIIVIGGKLRHSERSVVTYDYMFNFSQINIKKCFIGAGGITNENGVSDFDIQEAVTRKTIIDRSEQIYVAADSSKFGRDVTINIVPLHRVHTIITDIQLSKNLSIQFSNKGTNIVLAGG